MTEPILTVGLIQTRDEDPNLNAASNKVSWVLICAGVAVALAMQLPLNVRAAGTGADAIRPASIDNRSAPTALAGTAVRLVVSGLIASFVGGYIARIYSGLDDIVSGAGLAAPQVAATAFSAGANLAFIGLTIGVIVAGIGGAVGTTHSLVIGTSRSSANFI